MFYKHSDYEGKRRNHQFLPINFAYTHGIWQKNDRKPVQERKMASDAGKSQIEIRKSKFTELGVVVIDRLRAMAAACRYGIQIARFRKPCHCPPTVGGILRLES